MRKDPRRTLVVLLAAATALAVAVTGQTSLLALVVPFVVPLGYWLRRDGRPPGLAFQATFQIAALAFLGLFALAVLRMQLLSGAVTLTVLVQVYYLLLPPTHAVLNRLALVSFFQFVALAAATTRVFFVLLVLTWLVVGPALLTLAALESRQGGASRSPVPLPRSLWRAGMRASVLVLLAGALFFVVLPRYEAGLLQSLRRAGGERTSGFSDRVQLGDIGRILQSDAVVMRVTVDGDVTGDVRWRGVALERFTGRGWILGSRERDVLGGEVVSLAERREGGVAVSQLFELEDRAPRAIFHLPGAESVEPEGFRGVEVDGTGNLWRWGRYRQRVRYRVVSRPGGRATETLSDAEIERLTRLPDMDPRIAELAESIVAGVDAPATRAATIEQYLRSAHAYSLDVRDRGVEDPVGRFLLERAPGHCEYFATGMVVILRTLGVPSRVVNGFQRGTRSRFSDAYVVRQRDAHSWVEAWLPGRGWTTYDPTPVVATGVGGGDLADALRNALEQLEIAWDDHVIGFNYTHQLSFLITVRDAVVETASSVARRGVGWVGGVAVLVVLAVGAAALRARSRRGRSPRPEGAVAYQRALRVLEKRGFRRRPGQTAWELAREVARRDAALGPPLLEVTRLYLDARFGGRRWDPRRGAELLAELASAPGRDEDGRAAA